MEGAPEDLFFARQVTTNACATQAILSILLNANNSTSTSDSDSKSNSNSDNGSDTNNNNDSPSHRLELGETLSNLQQFTQSFPADLKGESIGASEEIRSAHNSFARKEAFWMGDGSKRVATKDDEVFHFVAYVPHKNGTVYELDGLQPGPIPVGTYEPTSSSTSTSTSSSDFPWLSVARSAIQQRIEKYVSSEIKFNLMALTADRRTILQSKIDANTNSNSNSNSNALRIQMELETEQALRDSWKEENERRRHNYLPFCVELLKALGKAGVLQECTQRANERMRAKRL